MDVPARTIWTIGHSTRSSQEFIDLLQGPGIQTLIDVRSFPGSRRYPHFNKENLEKALAAAGIDYVHMPELGGRRKAKPDSLNMAWRNESFRGYADYMETAPFREGIERLVEMGAEKRVAIMCSEAVWWRCHRSMIADYLRAKGIKVLHIISEGKTEEHPFTSAARIVNDELSYRGVFDTAAD